MQILKFFSSLEDVKTTLKETWDFFIDKNHIIIPIGSTYIFILIFMYLGFYPKYYGYSRSIEWGLLFFVLMEGFLFLFFHSLLIDGLKGRKILDKKIMKKSFLNFLYIKFSCIMILFLYNLSIINLHLISYFIGYYLGYYSIFLNLSYYTVLATASFTSFILFLGFFIFCTLFFLRLFFLQDPIYFINEETTLWESIKQSIRIAKGYTKQMIWFFIFLLFSDIIFQHIFNIIKYHDFLLLIFIIFTGSRNIFLMILKIIIYKKASSQPDLFEKSNLLISNKNTDQN